MLIIEDGSVVASANSTVSVADVIAYLTARNVVAAFAALSQAQQEAAVIFAADYLCNEMRFRYVGSRVSIDQTLPFPRAGASEYRGPAIPSNVVPWRFKAAQCALAGRLASSGQDLQPDLERGGMVVSEKVDVLETRWSKKAPAETVIAEINGILRPILLVDVIPAPYQAMPVVLTPFADGEFADTPSTGLTGS